MNQHPVAEDPTMIRKDVRRPSAGQPIAEYEVGYGKPPSASRFKKGKSGNPKGRPPGRRNLDALYTMMMRAVLKGKLDEALKATTLLRAAEGDAARKATKRRPRAADEFTDEEILQIVKERKLTWLALFDLYLDEKLTQELQDRSDRDGGPAAQGE